MLFNSYFEKDLCNECRAYRFDILRLWNIHFVFNAGTCMDRDSRTQHVKWCSWGLASGLRCTDGGYYLATDRNLGIELDSRRIWRVSLLFKMDRCTDFSHHGNSLVASGRKISKRKQSSLQTRKIAWFFGGSSSYFR